MSSANKKLHILVFGGTNFVGQAIAVEALARGHHVTTFNRGSKLPPDGAKSIIGDRLAHDGYRGLDGLTFDTVIDTWWGDPVAVRTAVAALSGRISHYAYISTISVYDRSRTQPPLSEESPLLDPEHCDFTYGADKRGGEIAAGGANVPVLIPRPGVIIDPCEGIDGRLHWWLGRMERGGPTLAPGPRDNGLQYVDVRDLAAFVISGAETGLSGVYNLLSQPKHTTIGELLDTANVITGSRAELVWRDPEPILRAGISPWFELPCWHPPGLEHDWVCNCNVEKAYVIGFRARPVRETLADSWAWLQTQTQKPPLYGTKWGLNPAKESIILREQLQAVST
jgi:2'-hydroxyisoflavone reductase